MQPTKITTVPNAELLGKDDVLHIKLAGQEWPVPLLAPRQNNIIVPLFMRHAGQPSADLFTQERMQEISTIVFTALTRGHKSITRDEFDDMPISFPEMIDALEAIRIQARMFKPVPKNGVDTGEVAGTSTGTP